MWDLVVSVPDHCLSLYFTFFFFVFICALVVVSCIFALLNKVIQAFKIF